MMNAHVTWNLNAVGTIIRPRLRLPLRAVLRRELCVVRHAGRDVLVRGVANVVTIGVLHGPVGGVQHAHFAALVSGAKEMIGLPVRAHAMWANYNTSSVRENGVG